jgi:hypothetical protein
VGGWWVGDGWWVCERGGWLGLVVCGVGGGVCGVGWGWGGWVVCVRVGCVRVVGCVRWVVGCVREGWWVAWFGHPGSV